MAKASAIAQSKRELAEKVAARVQAIDIRLVETAAKLALDDHRLPTKLHLEIQTTPALIRQEREVRAHVRFDLRGRYEQSAEEDPLRITVVFCLRYSLSSTEGLRKPHIMAFGELNSTSNTWPYFREYVQSVTVRMGLPALPIPVFSPISGQLLKAETIREPTKNAQRAKPGPAPKKSAKRVPRS